MLCAFLAFVMAIGMLSTMAYANVDAGYEPHAYEHGVVSEYTGEPDLVSENSFEELVEYEPEQEVAEYALLESEQEVEYALPEPEQEVEYALPEPEQEVAEYALPEPEKEVEYTLPNPEKEVEYALPEPEQDYVVYDSYEIESYTQVYEIEEVEFEDIVATYVEIEPLWTLFTHMTTSVDDDGLEVEPGDLIRISVIWMRFFDAPYEPISIWATNGAELRIPDASGVVFNGGAGTISNVVHGDGVVSFRANNPLQLDLNEIVFYVAAPSSVEEFSLSVLIGFESDRIPGENFFEETFIVNSPFYVVITPDEIEDDMTFNISARSVFGGGNTVAITFVNVECGHTFVAPRIPSPITRPDGGFDFVNIRFPNNAPPGVYRVEAGLLTPLVFNPGPPPILIQPEVLAEYETFVTFTRPVPSLTVNTTLGDSIEDDTPFHIYGNITRVSNAYRVLARIVNSGGTTIWQGFMYWDDVDSGEYSIGPVQFGDAHPAGTYYIYVGIVNRGLSGDPDDFIEVVAPVRKEITHTKSVVAVAPTITSPALTSATRGVATDFIVIATGTPTINFMVSGEPTGVIINDTTGLITIASTTPAGSHTFTITATNAAGSATQSFTLNVIDTLPSSGIRSIHAGSSSTFIVTQGNRLYAMGRNNLGQLGTQDTTERLVPTFVMDNVQQVATSDLGFTVILRTTGRVYTVGNNIGGQLGINSTSNTVFPTRVPTLETRTIVQVAAGSNHAMALCSLGEVWTWGSNVNGQLGHSASGSGTRSLVPVRAQGLSDITYIAAGCFIANSFAVGRDGSLWAWGANTHGQLANGTAGSGAGMFRDRPQRVAGISDVESVSVNGTHVAAIRRNGHLYLWGNDNNPTGVARVLLVCRFLGNQGI